MQIDAVVQEQDALVAEGDVLALKFAQNLYGLDSAVVERFRLNRLDIAEQLHDRREVALVDTRRLFPTSLYTTKAT